MNQTMCFRWLREVISRPSTYICSGLRVPVLWKLSETTSFTRGRFGDEICAGILARRMDEPNYVVQYWSPPLVAFRVLVLPADPPLHSGPCTATETLADSDRRGQVPWARNYFCDSTKRCIFHGPAKRLLAPAPSLARDSIECTPAELLAFEC